MNTRILAFIPMVLLLSTTQAAESESLIKAHEEQCQAYAELEKTRPVEKIINFEACMAELRRLDNAEPPATDYAYNH